MYSFLTQSFVVTSGSEQGSGTQPYIIFVAKPINEVTRNIEKSNINVKRLITHDKQITMK